MPCQSTNPCNCRSNCNYQTNYYKVGYVQPRLVNKPPESLCYPYGGCGTKHFSMCRYPNTYNQARVYFPKYQAQCGCNKYLTMV